MIRLLVTVFLLGHGLVHAIMFALPFSAQARQDLGFNPSHSWLIGDNRAVALVAAVLVTLAFVLAAVTFAFHIAWWPTALIVASVLSVLLLTLYFSRWWTVGYAIDLALVATALAVARA